MANWNQEPPPVPWLPVHGDRTGREPLAPSKPPVPTARATRTPIPQPEPIEDDDDEIIAAVTAPPSEEIMPTNGRAAWDATPTAAPGTHDDDPVRSLGDAALRRASLSASGARTPLGGVGPAEPSTRTPEPPAAPARPVRASAPQSGTLAPGFMTAGAHPPTNPGPGASAVNLNDDSTPYTPSFGGPADPNPAGDDADGGDKPPAQDRGTPWWRSWPLLVIVGLLVMGGIGYGIVTALSDDEDVALTPPVVVAPHEQAPLDPIAIEDPTSFQAALPGVVGTFSLIGSDSPDVATLDLPVRAVEASILTYSDQESTVTVRAVQHFNAEDAVAQFEALAADGTDREAVTAGGVEVGKRATVTAEVGETIVWRNTTATFEATGPADAVAEFFAQFPL